MTRILGICVHPQYSEIDENGVQRCLTCNKARQVHIPCKCVDELIDTIDISNFFSHKRIYVSKCKLCGNITYKSVY